MVKFYIKVRNVVASAKLGKQIPLNRLVAGEGSEESTDSKHAKGDSRGGSKGDSKGSTEYEPKQFPGLVYRVKEPRSAALIFASGRIVCTGTKSIENANQAVKEVVKMLNSAGIRAPKKYDVQVESIVASTKIDAKLNLKELTVSLDNAEYKPEQFPGLVYRMANPKVSLILFRSGKVLCKGAQTMNDVQKALDKLKKNLESAGISVKPVAG